MSKYDVSKFRNVTVALNTPFKKDGSVDVDAIKAVCRYFRDKFWLPMLRRSAQLPHQRFHAYTTVQVRRAFTSTGPRLQKQQTFRSLFTTFLSSPDLIFL